MIDSGERRSLCGWGRTAPCDAQVYRPVDTVGAVDLLGELAEGDSGGGLIARGAGLSYGDAAQISDGAVVELTGLDRVLSIDHEHRTATVEAGVTVAALMARLAAQELTLPVAPGTRFITLAGAIASDIHGKNHHRDGGFARHVLAIRLWTPGGDVQHVSPQSDAELFYATLGGMGLTGVVLEATLAVEPMPSPWVAVDVERTQNLEQTLELLNSDRGHRYSVAWLDLLAPGACAGRAVVGRANRLDAPPRTPGGLARFSATPAALGRPPLVQVPRAVPDGLLRPAVVRALNAVRWRMSPRHAAARPSALAPYLFPLDALGAWNRLYGSAGFLQYQFVIPAGSELELERCFEVIRARRLPVFLAVFKRFGAAFGGPLSFPLEGWTLAIDMPADAPGLGPALDELDELVAGCGGRVYLAKDARLRGELLETMYPRLSEFRGVHARVDPAGLLRSDLSVRLGLCEGAR